MLNQVQIIGHLGADPETRSFQNGGQVCNCRVAVTEKWKDKNGERKERTEWVTVAIFSEGLVKVASTYLRKGSKVFLQGKLQTRKWQDQQGNDRYSTEVVLQGFDAKLVMLDGPGEGSRGNTSPQQSNDDWGGGGDGFGNPPAHDLDDDVPFASCDPRLDLPRRRAF